MLRVIVAAVLMLSMAVVLTAQNDGLSREELRQRRAQLNAQADRIRNEARFRGRFSINPQMNKISHIEGRFENITFPAMEDTSGIEQTFDRIIDRIIPFFPVDREDLEKRNLSIGSFRGDVNLVDYVQTANGYEIEGASRIRISYSYIDNRVIIVNSLAYLDPSVLPTEPMITKEEAKSIFEHNVGKPAGWPLPAEKGVRLLYCRVRDERNISTNEFRLSWRIGNIKRTLMIDAITGEIIGATISRSY